MDVPHTTHLNYTKIE
jgi:hypothetical protein